MNKLCAWFTAVRLWLVVLSHHSAADVGKHHRGLIVRSRDCACCVAMHKTYCKDEFILTKCSRGVRIIINIRLTYRGRCYRFCCYTNIDGMLGEACRVRLEACNVNIVCLSLKIKGLPSVFGHFLLGTAFEDSEYTNESNSICIRFSELIYIHA